ncbi:hypothetical protein C823_007623 [Eubacterium plexicaudatum ASF492]|uniref:Uncharacterized protein n=1 Tax=Eubacterium plexicaudatum ASF492 TaxID=1235802 RepID=N1ZWN4_9FIRM|nr:hypothetical protein C823_007623 [Eubacterium plexicaudatum ASF492]
MANITTFRELADSVFLKIKDLDLAQLPEEIAYQIVKSYIKPACVAFQSCSDQNLFDRDDKLEQFNFKLSDVNFEILSEYMIVKWLDSQILSTTTLKARLSSSDFKSLNLHSHLSKLMELRSMYKAENDQLAINNSYKDSKIFDLVTKRKRIYK